MGSLVTEVASECTMRAAVSAKGPRVCALFYSISLWARAYITTYYERKSLWARAHITTYYERSSSAAVVFPPLGRNLPASQHNSGSNPTRILNFRGVFFPHKNHHGTKQGNIGSISKKVREKEKNGSRNAHKTLRTDIETL